ncbi:MAG: LptF/LptG family permease [Bacteroidetes bacterium]|nr:LptF/LptG family permease [Bacteroidota bacterium]
MILVRYILKNHVVPFLFSIVILIFIFVLQFMMKFADRLVGKGLSLWVILQLIIYNLAWIVVLVVPMSVLVATLMAFGAMSQNNEISIMKATGVSLYKMMTPPLIASVFVALSLVYFNNHIYPDANHAARLLMEDISRKKPTLSLVPGVFSQEVPNYAILVRDIDPVKNELKQVTIYDYSHPPKINIVTASFGKIYYAPDQKVLIMDLQNGEIHESDNADRNEYRKIRFQRHKIAMPADQFTFEQSGPGGPRGDREMGAQHMLVIVDSLNAIRTKLLKEYEDNISSLISSKNQPVRLEGESSNNRFVYLRSQQKISQDQNHINNTLTRLDWNRREMDRYWVEIHKKYSLPFACIVFVLIGAPLGTMMRRGGFGMAAGISLIFFLTYWAFLIGGEKLADRALLSPFAGIWSANILLGIVGILLMIKSAREKVTLNFEFITKWLPKSWRSQEESDENS